MRACANACDDSCHGALSSVRKGHAGCLFCVRVGAAGCDFCEDAGGRHVADDTGSFSNGSSATNDFTSEFTSELNR